MKREERERREKSEKEKREVKGQCELSKLAVLLDERKEKKDGEMRWRPRPKGAGRTARAPMV